MSVVGVDVGGTHVTAAIIDVAGARIIDASRIRRDVNSAGSAQSILGAWCDAIRASIEAATNDIRTISFAMPGPFDYARGISAIRGQNKFDSLFGVNIRQLVLDHLALARRPDVVFRNDAECFGLGEAWLGAGRGVSRLVAITLGTGLGSAFIRDGRAISAGSEVPESGQLYCLPFEGAVAEENFSARGLLRRFRESSGRQIDDVAQIADLARAGDTRAMGVFTECGGKLGQFLLPWLRKFAAERLVVGGGIARSWALFAGALRAGLAGCDARPAELFEDAALLGAARVARS